MLRLALVAKVQGSQGFPHLDQLHDVQQVGAAVTQAFQQLVQVLGLDLENFNNVIFCKLNFNFGRVRVDDV